MRARSLHTAALGATIAVIAVVAPAARVGAAPAATCSATSGVTVIVDFSHFHRAIERGCAPGSPATALAALQAVGFSTAGTTQYGDAFLCRIDNLPSRAAEACTNTPPAKSSWSFYWARASDAAWTYSRLGVLSYRPPSGTIIAFAFGDLAKPGVVPAAAIRVTHTSAATTTTRPPPTAPATTAPVTTTPVVATGATTMPTASAVAVAPTTTAVPTTTVPTTTSIAVSGRHAAARIVDRPPIKHVTVKSDSGSPAGALFAAVIVVGLGAATALTVRARRRRAA